MVLNTRRILEKGSRMTTTTRIMMITIIIIMIIKKTIGSFFSSIYSIKSNVLNGYDGVNRRRTCSLYDKTFRIFPLISRRFIYLHMRNHLQLNSVLQIITYLVHSNVSSHQTLCLVPTNKPAFLPTVHSQIWRDLLLNTF